jgi:hypothetical protein
LHGAGSCGRGGIGKRAALRSLWGRSDPVHDYRDPESPLDLNEPERFAADYRKAGGDIEIAYIDQDKRTTGTAVEPLVGFLQRHLM